MGMGAGNNLEQTAFRGRFDDGVESLQESEGGAAWIVALNTDWSQMPNSTFRMRILIEHPSVASSINISLDMRYSHNGGAYTIIDGSSSVVRLFDTTHWVTRDNSTDFVGRLGSGNWDTTDNFGLIDADPFPQHHLQGPAAEQREMETEWCLRIRGADVSPGDTIDFRCFTSGGAIFTRGYIFTPRITVLDPLLDTQMTGAPAAVPVLVASSEAAVVQARASSVAQPVLVAETEAVPVLKARTEATVT